MCKGIGRNDLVMIIISSYHYHSKIYITTPMRSITNHDTLYPSPVQGAWQNRLYTQEENNGHTHLPCHTYFYYDITLDIYCLRVKCPICLCLTPNLQCRVFSRDRSSSISRSSSSSDSTSSTSISSRTSSSNRRNM